MENDMNNKKIVKEKPVDLTPEAREIVRAIPRMERKRCRIMIADGVPWEKAVELCKKQWRQLPPDAHPTIRARMESYAQWTQECPIPTEPNTKETFPYFQKENRYSEVVIQNSTGMTENQAQMLHQMIISKIMQFPKSEGPRFKDYVYMSGTLLVNCRDKQSQIWLQQEVSQFEPWPGAKLSASIVPVTTETTVFRTLLPESEATDAAQAFTLLKIQNRGLNTEDWTLMSTKSVRKGLDVTISVDQRSLDVLKAANYRVCLGFRTINFKQVSPPPQSIQMKQFAYRNKKFTRK